MSLEDKLIGLHEEDYIFKDILLLSLIELQGESYLDKAQDNSQGSLIHLLPSLRLPVLYYIELKAGIYQCFVLFS